MHARVSLTYRVKVRLVYRLSHDTCTHTHTHTHDTHDTHTHTHDTHDAHTHLCVRTLKASSWSLTYRVKVR